MQIRQTEYGNWIVCESSYTGGTYYDADTLDEALEWCRQRDIEIDEDGILYYK